MNKKMRFTSALLALLLTVPTLLMYADAVTVEDIDGVPTVFVSGFGRISYEGKPRQSYKSISEALSALGEKGGKLVLQGNGELTSLDGIGNIEIAGIGVKSTGNIITVKDTVIDLKNDLTLSTVAIKTDKDMLINVGANTFTAGENFDSYYTEKYNANGANAIEYPNPVSVSAGSFEGESVIDLYSGHFASISAVTGGDTASGNINITLDGVSAESVVIGSLSGDATVNGNVVFNANDTDIGTLAVGDGKINGNVILNFGNAVKAGETASAGKLDVTGKIVAITDTAYALPAGLADIQIKLKYGKASPVYEGTKLLGFAFNDKRGFDTKTVYINGEEKTSETGVFELADGVYEVVPNDSIDIRLSADSSYVAGYEDGTFLPQNNMTRAEAITTLARLIADESKFKPIIKSGYNDVAEDAWYSPYIGLFEKLGYLKGLEDNGNIKPNERITRGEFCYLISGAFPVVSAKTSGVKEFSDVPEKYPFKDAVSLAGFQGIVGGYEDGTFRPDNLVTRAEVVTMINRMIGRTPSENDVTVFSDTASHWAKGQINAAACPSVKEGVTMWTKNSINKFDEYMQYRYNLTNTKVKLESEKKLNVAFIGGSVTAGSGASITNETSWRGLTMKWFRETYPECEINEVNAAIGDSYTKYAVYRMDNDLLRYDYDLLFIEYAINDSPWYSAKQDTETVIYFETLVRRVYEHNPNADIVIVYTFDDKLDRTVPYFPTAAAQEVIAKHYDIPSVNFGRALGNHIAEDESIKWGDCFTDYVHPNDRGYLYYAAVLTEYLSNALSDENCGTEIKAKVLPEQHTKQKLWYDLTMLEADEIDLSLSKNWVLSEDGKKIYPTSEDNELVIKTYGSDICIAAPRAESMYYSVDGGAEQLMKMNRKPQTLFENLSDGEHTLRIRAVKTSSLQNASIQRVMYNGKK